MATLAVTNRHLQQMKQNPTFTAHAHTHTHTYGSSYLILNKIIQAMKGEQKLWGEFGSSHPGLSSNGHYYLIHWCHTFCCAHFVYTLTNVNKLLLTRLFMHILKIYYVGTVNLWWMYRSHIISKFLLNKMFCNFYGAILLGNYNQEFQQLSIKYCCCIYFSFITLHAKRMVSSKFHHMESNIKYYHFTDFCL